MCELALMLHLPSEYGHYYIEEQYESQFHYKVLLSEVLPLQAVAIQ